MKRNMTVEVRNSSYKDPKKIQLESASFWNGKGVRFQNTNTDPISPRGISNRSPGRSKGTLPNANVISSATLELPNTAREVYGTHLTPKQIQPGKAR